MTQANDVLETIDQSESELELLVDDGEDRDDLFDAQSEEEEDGKSPKGRASRRRTREYVYPRAWRGGQKAGRRCEEGRSW